MLNPGQTHVADVTVLLPGGAHAGKTLRIRQMVTTADVMCASAYRRCVSLTYVFVDKWCLQFITANFSSLLFKVQSEE